MEGVFSYSVNEALRELTIEEVPVGEVVFAKSMNGVILELSMV